MTDFSLDNEMNIYVTARLISKVTNGPIKDSDYSVKLFDKDQFDDDFLGESQPDEEGVVTFSIDNAQFGDFLQLESRPDFYFVVFKNETEIFRSKVMEDVDLEAKHNDFKMGKGEMIDLGSFLVDR